MSIIEQQNIKFNKNKTYELLHTVKRNIRKQSMTARQRLNHTLNHLPVDRVCVDFGAGGQTGIGAGAVHRLRKALLGGNNYRVKIIEPYQMLGEIDTELRQALGIDVVGINTKYNMFGFTNDNWKPFEMNDGTPVLVPGDFNYTRNENGDTLMYPLGDTTAEPCAMMPKTGYFFDALNRQKPIDESKLNPDDNCEEFTVLSRDDLDYYAQTAKQLYNETDCGIYMTIGGAAFGDIALVPATWMKDPKGIRGVEEWYISTVLRTDYVYKVFEKQCETALKNIELLADAVGDMVQVVFVSGTDFGHQRGLFASPDTYRNLYKSFQKQVNDKIHELTNWKIFIHSCGAISELLPELIEAGFDIINPVQLSATGMDPVKLKKEFGRHVTFWGGGVDSQKTLPFGTPEEVYKEVYERLGILSQGGGYVFNGTHNIQSDVPVENILAMFKALHDFNSKG